MKFKLMLLIFAALMGCVPSRTPTIHFTGAISVITVNCRTLALQMGYLVPF